MFKAVSLALLLAGAPVIDTPVVDGVEITQVLEHYPVTGNNAQEGGGVHFLSETGSEPDPVLPGFTSYRKQEVNLTPFFSQTPFFSPSPREATT